MENQQARYEITTQTGKHALAGTDANVYIRIEGEKDSLDEMQLTTNEKNPFEKDQSDTFILSGKDVGKITKITIRHDNTNKNAGWQLESVTIKSSSNAQSGVHFFKCNAWLTEKALSVELLPSSLPDYIK